MGVLNKLKDKFKKEKILVLSEKYNVALNYSKVMNCPIRGDGYFEGDKYVITWSDGHLCELYDPEDYDENYKKWKLEDLPIIPNGFWIKVRDGYKQKRQFKIIKALIEREDITAVAVGTDSGREGTLIGWYILMLAENKKTTYRICIDTPAAKDIAAGFKRMRTADSFEAAYRSAAARDEIDWIIGYNFSRLYSLISGKTRKIGRCKTVVLNLICEREDLINRFKGEDYFDITAVFDSKKCCYPGTLRYDDRIKNKAEAEKITKNIENEMGTIQSIDKDIKEVAPPSLFNLNDLSRAMNRRYGYTVEEVYEIAQKLYEEYKIISYPRTESRYIRSSMIEEIQDIINCNKFGKFATVLCDIKGLDLFIKRNVNDKEIMEHTAIVPVVNEDIESIYYNLEKKEQLVYDEILNNFITAFMENYVYESIKIITKVKCYEFITNTQNVLNRGWHSIGEENKNRSEFDYKDLEIDEDVKVGKISILSKSTQPPARYTDDTLLEILENPAKFIDDITLKRIARKCGIGTSATRKGIITDLIDDKYIIRDKKYFLPTIEGKELIQLIENDRLKKPYFTAEIESKLQEVFEGKLNKDDLIKEIINFTSENIKELKEKMPSGNIEKNKYIGQCPFCNVGKVVKAADKGFGCTALKKNGCRFYVSNNILGVQIDENQVSKLITKGETDSFKFNGPKESFRAKIVLDKENKKTKFKKSF